jgi:hypothetical protein
MHVRPSHPLARLACPGGPDGRAAMARLAVPRPDQDWSSGNVRTHVSKHMVSSSELA